MGKQFATDEFFGGKVDYPTSLHLACALLIDTSASMGVGNRAIDSLNAGIKRFKEDLMADPVMKKAVDVALVTFNSEVEVVSKFQPVKDMPTPELRAGGKADMAQGIQTAIDLVKDRTRQYQNLGTPCCKPWIIMVTRGVSTSSEFEMGVAAERIRQEEEKGSHGRVSFWTLGIGDYDPVKMLRLTKRVIGLKDVDFSGFLDWMVDSMDDMLWFCTHDNVTMNLPPLPEYKEMLREVPAIDEGWF